MSDLISKEMAIDKLQKEIDMRTNTHDDTLNAIRAGLRLARNIIEDMPVDERDIPLKPIEITDNTWGIPERQPVCPRCDNYLGRIAFLGDSRGKRITYCETCGQMIVWQREADE